MRIQGGDNPLDATGVHPESYEAAEKLLEKQGFRPEDIIGGKLVGLSLTIKDYKKLAEELGIGEITLRDIVKELEKPARDPVRNAQADPADRCAGDEGSERGHDLKGHGAKCDRLRGVRGYRRTPGRAGTHFPDYGEVHQASAGSGERGRYRGCEGHERGLEEKEDPTDDAGDFLAKPQKILEI